MNKRHTTIILGILSFCAYSYAQDLNPEIIVTNEYVSKMPEVAKQDVPMVVPDSLREFKLNFDYSVFDNPYEGSNEFKPYVVNLKAARSEMEASRLWLRAGAGYSFHPDFRLAWQALRKDRLRLGTYASFGGYSGAYRTVGADFSASRQNTFTGHDFGAKAGVQASFHTKPVAVEADIHYGGVFTGTPASGNGSYNNAGLAFDIRSNPSRDAFLKYDARLGLDIASDRQAAAGTLNETRLVLGGSLVPSFDLGGVKFLADVDFRNYSCSGALGTSALSFSVVPKLAFTFGNLDLCAGLNIAVAATTGNPAGQYGHKGQVFYPDVKARLKMLDGALSLYGEVTGGVKPVSYSDLKARNHWFDTGYAPVGALLDNEIERLNATLGARAVIARVFQLDASAGYGFYSASPFDGVFRLTPAGTLAPCITYADNGMFHADVTGSMVLDKFTFDSALRFRAADVAAGEAVILPALFSGNIRAIYKWAGRISTGIWVEGCTARKAQVPDYDGTSFSSFAALSMPGYVDIGLEAEYSLTRRWSAWAKIGNLLDANIRRTPLYVENGINFSLGLTLNF